MQPRLRTLVWREMPPCVRRVYLAWARRFHYAELLLGELYLSWKKSPTWNFVAIAGTLGILLTILLFLVPWKPETTLQAGVREEEQRKSHGLDSTLAEDQLPRDDTYPDDTYPVELLDANETQLAEEPTRRRRRTVIPAEPEPDIDWFADDAETREPPRLGWDIEVVTKSRRPRRERQIEEDVSWMARTESFQEADIDGDWDFAREDLWQPFDDSRRIGVRGSARDDFRDHRTVGASVTTEPFGEPLQPALLPETAASHLDVELELSWNRPASRRRRSSPQLYLRNLGPDAIPQIDVIAGSFPEFQMPRQPASRDFLNDNWSLPAPGEALLFDHVAGQSVTELSSGDEKAVSWPGETVSVLVTAFVGGVTDVAVLPSTPRPQSRPEMRIPSPAPRPAQPPPRAAARPHLKLTIGTPGRLSAEKMVSVPMQVVNDGNVPLDEVVVIAEIPAKLEHRYGRQVHYRLGRMLPGETKSPTLLMTPLKAGTSFLPLKVVDGQRSTEDSGEVRIDVADSEIAKEQPAETEARAADDDVKLPPRRRRSRERTEEPRTK